MKNKGFFRERIFPVLFMIIITVLCISLVSFVHLSTKELVSLNEFLFLRKAVLYAANIPLPESAQEISNIFEERVQEKTNSSGTIYFQVHSPQGEDETIYVLFQNGAGLWGEITAVIGYKNDLNTVTGIDFVKQNETPGLGARITESWFKEQFRGKKGPFRMVPEGTATGINQIDAITGASRTSQAVLKMMNTSLENLRTIAIK